MRARVCLSVRSALRRPRGPAAQTAALVAVIARRTFVDTPMPDEAVVSGMSMPNVAAPPATPMGDPSSDSADGLGSSYAYPLDVSNAAFKLYGEPNTFGAGDANRIFSSAKIHSYDPTILFNDLRLQDVRSTEVNGTGGFSGAGGGGSGGADTASTAAVDAEAATRQAEDEANNAEMRSGRNKQVAGGAAAMAAAMLDSRRAVDGIALVPGHPLPVVFPRPDGLPPPLRFVKKFGPGGAQKTRAGKRLRQAKAESEEDTDAAMYGEVMESEGRVESTSLQHSIAWKVQVLDEHHKPAPVKPFQHFREAADVLPHRVMQGLEDSGFSRPTLLQSAAIPQLMRGRDVVGVSPNGSGTTVAYAVPSIAVLVKVKAAEKGDTAVADKAKSSSPGGDAAAGGSSTVAQEQPEEPAAAVVAHPIVVVLCPTRQTVMRTAAMYVSLTGEDVRLITAYRSTAEEEEKQRAAIQKKNGCDVLVSTPARLHALLRDGVVDVDNTHVMAVDKANEILEAAPTPDGVSMREHLEFVLKKTKDNRVAHQLSVWCSEVVPAVESMVHRYMSPLAVTVMVTREEHTNVNVRQILYALPSKEDRIKAIQRLYDTRAILKRHQVVVFCAYRETAEQVAADLIKALAAPSSMVKFVHSGLRARRRNEVLKSFQHGDIRILVGTDVATKRLDVEELEHVIHYDLPASTEIYMQRVSQVGRSGRQGTSHTFLTAGDARVPLIAKFVEKQTGHALSEETRAMIRDIEASGGEDSWDTPVLRLQNHAASNTKWRVRGRREMRQQVESLSGFLSESDKKPLGTSS
ncbi:putative mitochondrial DEAD/DEAH box helicase [Leptomonas pyrrhocoris]|uniref:RNA helicase n=1 Tax=Leptomonas pyrrhocoris TaxID=157538 RepID=A0A0M9FU38_LEPPY|nr:putative mitochondrial DEAD/DEAH box helicase [Leptomonas pyrrhocoris]KPA75886.1 putative mitochondrial DEAD/DEAH box helicase [Leptomonas pyrrhocoris]|eukprot:XP_015654325.1 putative mitochondrial DEAD/DEAH box helicase [Leptomonas pyrrhocoris]